MSYYVKDRCIMRIFSYNKLVMGILIVSSIFVQEVGGITINGIRDYKKKLREKFEAINQKHAWAFAQSLTKKDRKSITLHDVLHMHYLILRNIDNANAGRLRTVNVKLRALPHIKFPHYTNVPRHVDDFFTWLHTVEGDDVTVAIRAFCKFVLHIHPFADGNGRTSRLLKNVLLVQAGYEPVHFHKKINYPEYYKIYIPALKKVLLHKDIRDFEALIRSRLKKTPGEK